MSRDQRTEDNWALLFAQELALKTKTPLTVVFSLVPDFLGATIRQYGFMLRGLEEVERRLNDMGIDFRLLLGGPEEEIPKFTKENDASVLVTDFSPLRTKRNWTATVSERIDIPFYEVDTHNIVPCWIASPKQEYAARTFRPKFYRTFPEFWEDFPRLHESSCPQESDPTDWSSVKKTLRVDRSVPEVDWIKPGETAAHKALRHFLKEKLDSYDEKRNDPTKNGQSGLSPYLHFGQISAQRVALEAEKTSARQESKEAFLEELMVRRELSDNFCFQNPQYDSFDAFPDWAKKTLSQHRFDPREYLYSHEKLEEGQTHDDLWNAAQMEMVLKGKMHGYMRMYWAKKILEWSESPKQAQRTAICLNDRYELDGRDPNGYVGIAWCIGGLHDRAWKERPIFGKVRYMSYKGARSKFKAPAYMESIATLGRE